MKKLTSTIKFVGLVLVFVISFYLMNAFTTTPLTANGDSIKNSRLLIENMELRKKYDKFQIQLDSIKNDLSKINYYDKYIYAMLNGASLDSNILSDYDTPNINYDDLSMDSIFNSIEHKSLLLSQLVAIELTELEMAVEKMGEIDGFPNISPIRTKDFIEVTSAYGWRKHPIYNKPMFHDGIDISARLGSPVYATASGVVDFVLYSKYGYGNRIVIKHSNGYETLYAHLRTDIRVKRGWKVKKGDLIGTVGSSGTSTGPHLHYEIRLNDDLKDPLAYFYTYMTNDLLADNEKD